MAGLYVEILVDERRRHVLGENVEHHRPAVLEVAQHLVPPIEDFGSRGRPIELHSARVYRVGLVEKLVVAQQNSQRQVLAEREPRYC